MPRFLEMERAHRSVILGLRASDPRRHDAAAGRALRPLRRAAGRHGRARRRARATAPRRGRPAAHGGTELVRAMAIAGASTTGARSFEADAVIVATPAYAAARLLAPLDERLAERARRHRVRVVGDRDARLPRAPTLPHARRLRLRRAARRRPRAPRLHVQQPQVRGPRARGPRAAARLRRRRAAGPSWSTLDDAALVAVVRAELRALLGIAGEPVLVRVAR